MKITNEMSTIAHMKMLCICNELRNLYDEGSSVLRDEKCPIMQLWQKSGLYDWLDDIEQHLGAIQCRGNKMKHKYSKMYLEVFSKNAEKRHEALINDGYLICDLDIAQRCVVYSKINEKEETARQYVAYSTTFNDLIKEVCLAFSLDELTFGNAALGVGFSVNGVCEDNDGNKHIWLHGVNVRIKLPQNYEGKYKRYVDTREGKLASK